MLWWCHCQVASAFWASVTDGRWRHAMSTDRQRTCQSVHRVVSSVRSSATRLCVSAGASTLLVERCLARGAWSHRSCPARRSTIPVSDKLTTACNVLLSLPLLAILRTSTHWRQSQIWHDRLCRSQPCQIRLCRKSTKSTVSLWPCTHWRQRNSTRSTLSKSTMSNYTLTQVNKVNRVALAPYTLATSRMDVRLSGNIQVTKITQFTNSTELSMFNFGDSRVLTNRRQSRKSTTLSIFNFVNRVDFRQRRHCVLAIKRAWIEYIRIKGLLKTATEGKVSWIGCGCGIGHIAPSALPHLYVTIWKNIYNWHP